MAHRSCYQDIADPRLRVIRQEHSGSAAARNTGLRAASGEFVAFLDGDDFWAPQNLERQARFLETHPEVGMTFGHSRVVDENGHDMGYTQFHSRRGHPAFPAARNQRIR